jgi:pimeloyl-ACP methyl ester carboxylesterase
MNAMLRRLTRLIVLSAVVVAGVWLWREAKPTLAAAALILDLTGQQPGLRSWLPAKSQTVTTRDIDVATRHGVVETRLFTPAEPAGGTLAIFPGVHGGGVEEPRMNSLARQFAANGLRVLIAPLPELRRYTIRPRSTDDVEDVALWLSSQKDLAPTGKIGLVGVSFAGGLTLVAAGRPSLAGKLELVAAMGTHGDLPRAMKYLVTGVLPDGTAQPVHDYGSAVILLAGAHHFAPPDQVEPLRHAITTFLDASSLDVTNPAKSAVMFDEARRLEAALPEPAREVMGLVNRRDVKTLGPKLVPYLEELGGAAALSPERSPVTTAPVFLLHGSKDNVIPYTETPLLAEYLRAHGNRRVRSLLTPLISHANVGASRPPLGEVWRLTRFWASMLSVLSGA